MNREIKFRCVNKNGGQMYYGYEPLRLLHNEANGSTLSTIKAYNIMQYTGLKDKNRKEIYEGDIVDLHQTINGVSKFTVEWSTERLGWTLRYAENMVNPRTYEYSVSEVFKIEEIEVIGNIYENPELLNTTK